MPQISAENSKVLLQTLNQLANFLAHDPRSGEVAPVAETLRALLERLRTHRREQPDTSAIDLTAEEAEAVALATPHIVDSLGDVEFSLRTGRSTDEARAVVAALTAF